MAVGSLEALLSGIQMSSQAPAIGGIDARGYDGPGPGLGFKILDDDLDEDDLFDDEEVDEEYGGLDDDEELDEEFDEDPDLDLDDEDEF